jgi:hypothetical protein
MKSSAKAFIIGAIIGPTLGLFHLLIGGDTALPLLGVGRLHALLVHALWPGFAMGHWTYDHVPGGHETWCYLTAGFLALALSYGLLALVLSALFQRLRR